MPRAVPSSGSSRPSVRRPRPSAGGHPGDPGRPAPMTIKTDHATVAGAPILSLRGIAKNFGAVSALTDINLEVHSGAVVALVGANGAGKSTLVKIPEIARAPWWD